MGDQFNTLLVNSLTQTFQMVILSLTQGVQMVILSRVNFDESIGREDFYTA
jgi:hypothetical protein